MAEFIQQAQKNNDAVRDELVAGLTAATAYVAPKYFYDTLGSRLFEAICALPEYYPTRTEAAIFERYAQQIAQCDGPGATLIDLGAGNCAKAARLFPVLQPQQYVALDISADFLREALARLQQRFPAIAMAGIGLDFSGSLELPSAVREERRLFFYPGSSIGNFSPPQALAFLRRIRRACQPNGAADGGLLIGVDLVKDRATLEAAYDDTLGVTAAFNLNLLRHLNTLAGCRFRRARVASSRVFQCRPEPHRNAPGSAYRAHRALARRPAPLPGGRADPYRKQLQVHAGRFRRIAGTGRLRRHPSWTDAHGWFMVCHARAV